MIKSFTAESVAAALKLIRKEMGHDAVILKTRVCREEEADSIGGKVEVTACIDEAAAAMPTLMSKAPEKRVSHMMKGPGNITGRTAIDSSVTGGDTSIPARLEKKIDLILDSRRLNGIPRSIDRRFESIYLNLLDSDIPAEMVHRFVNKMSDRTDTDEDAEAVARDVIRECLKHYLTDEITIRSGMTLVFAGMPGAGKTSVMAKLAAYLVIDAGLKVRLASLDTDKVSAYEEISGYADILDIPFDISGDINKNDSRDTVLLVDTPSFGTDVQRQSKLLKKLNGIDVDMTFLVYSLCHRSSDLIDSISALRQLKATSLIATHLDETARWGGIPALAAGLDIPLAFVTNTPGGAGRIMHPDDELIADILLKSKEGYRD